MTDTSKMTAREFADWMWEFDLEDYEPFVAARDRAMLEAAADRVRKMPREKRASWANLEDAILGKPAFVPGQLVRSSSGVHIVVNPDDCMTDGCDAVRAHIDTDGRVIVDEVAT